MFMKLGLHVGYWGAGPPAGAVESILEAERLGYDSVWVAESWGNDAFTFGAWVAAHTETIKIGTGVVQISARTPTATAATTIATATGRTTTTAATTTRTPVRPRHRADRSCTTRPR